MRTHHVISGLLLSLTFAHCAASCVLGSEAGREADADSVTSIEVATDHAWGIPESQDSSHGLELLAMEVEPAVMPDAAPRGRCEEACMAYWEVIDRFCQQVPTRWKIRCHLAKSSGSAACHARCP